MRIIAELNQNYNKTKSSLFDCCASAKWVSKVMEYFPFDSLEQLCEIAKEQWFKLEKDEWLAVFQSHPKIGEKKADETKQVSKTHLQWSKKEQQQVQDFDKLALEQLREYNEKYLQKFGFIFIVCATGKSAPQMLNILKSRMKNSYLEEIENAAKEQNKITLIRIKKIKL
jgi:2-oxo-4-hydroxy-4-carboxy-5-ureidoimidazoline decarboxylase